MGCRVLQSTPGFYNRVSFKGRFKGLGFLSGSLTLEGL